MKHIKNVLKYDKENVVVIKKLIHKKCRYIYKYKNKIKNKR